MKRTALLIPSMGNADCYISMIDSLVNFTNTDLDVFITFNPKQDPNSVLYAGRCLNYTEVVAPGIVSIRSENGTNFRMNLFSFLKNKPIGYGGAINNSFREMQKHEEASGFRYDYVIFGNDDLVFTNNWLSLLIGSIEDEENNYTQASGMMGKRKIDKQYKFGMVGPVSNNVAGAQIFQAPDGTSYDEVAYRLSRNEKQNTVTTFLSGFCQLVKREMLDDLEDTLEYPEDGPIDHRNFPIGGYEDNDICLRAIKKGWKMKIANNCFIGHVGHQSLPEEQKNGMANRLPYYLKWESETKNDENKCIAAYRCAIKTVNQLAELITSVTHTLPIIDGIAFLLTNNPSKALASYDAQMFEQLPKFAQDFLTECSHCETVEQASHRMKNFIRLLVKGKIPVEVDFWDDEFNERDERNRTHEIAESMGADWILSVDTDEFPEERFNRDLFRRLLRHPDPSAYLYTVSWLNHWESTNLLRVDTPFGMQAGPRLWKVFKDNQRIHAGNTIGLHCGNAPEYSLVNFRASSFRFRHLSHVRGIDRWAKMKFYEAIDVDKRPELIGGSNYNHISKQEKVQVSLYNPHNGIGFFMLAYEKEDPDRIAYWLDAIYGVADKLVINWTGEWKKSDKKWLKDLSKTKVDEKDWKYKTGPSWKLAQYIRLFEVDVIHHPLKNSGLADCRNACIDYLCENSNNNNITWGMFFDPDEVYPDHVALFQSIAYFATTNDIHGFLWNFRNVIGKSDGKYDFAGSESIRMFKLDPTGEWRMSGLVHETFEAAANKMRERGQNPSVQILNKPEYTITNMGLLNTPELMSKKLTKYKRLLEQELSIDPLKSGSWLSLGLQYINDGKNDLAQTCLDRACMCAGSAYLPFKERALMALREGLALLRQARARIGSEFTWTPVCDEMIKVLEQMAPPAPIIPTDLDVTKGDVLPSFPYDRIQINEAGNFIVIPEGESNESQDKSNQERI